MPSYPERPAFLPLGVRLDKLIPDAEAAVLLEAEDTADDAAADVLELLAGAIWIELAGIDVGAAATLLLTTLLAGCEGFCNFSPTSGIVELAAATEDGES
jgi:hypothetical protein